MEEEANEEVEESEFWWKGGECGRGGSGGVGK